MPIGLELAAEDKQQDLAQQDEADDAQTHNPLALSTRTKAFCALLETLSEKNTRTMTSDEFDELTEEYDKLEGFERYAAGIELQRIGVNWLVTLDERKDGYDDELNGYDVYCQIRSDTPDEGYA